MSNEPSLTLDLDTDLAKLAILEEAVDQMLAPVADIQDAEATRYNIWLSIHELCVNIIKHAYGGESGPVTVIFTREGDGRTLVIRTYDRGKHTFNLDAWAPPDLSDPPIHGLGIFLIRQLMDEVDYLPEAQGSRWRLVKYLERATGVADRAGEGVTP